MYTFVVFTVDAFAIPNSNISIKLKRIEKKYEQQCEPKFILTINNK